MRLIVGMTGATGVIYGVRLLQRLKEAGVDTHLVISKWGARTLLHETPFTREQVDALATEVYQPNDMGAAIASGSFQASGMIIAPCSVKTLGAIAHGYGDSLVHRAADVTLKEKRRLLLAVSFSNRDSSAAFVLSAAFARAAAVFISARARAAAFFASASASSASRSSLRASTSRARRSASWRFASSLSSLVLRFLGWGFG